MHTAFEAQNVELATVVADSLQQSWGCRHVPLCACLPQMHMGTDTVMCMSIMHTDHSEADKIALLSLLSSMTLTSH